MSSLHPLCIYISESVRIYIYIYIYTNADACRVRQHTKWNTIHLAPRQQQNVLKWHWSFV